MFNARGERNGKRERGGGGGERERKRKRETVCVRVRARAHVCGCIRISSCVSQVREDEMVGVWKTKCAQSKSHSDLAFFLVCWCLVTMQPRQPQLAGKSARTSAQAGRLAKAGVSSEGATTTAKAAKGAASKSSGRDGLFRLSRSFRFHGKGRGKAGETGAMTSKQAGAQAKGRQAIGEPLQFRHVTTGAGAVYAMSESPRQTTNAMRALAAMRERRHRRGYGMAVVEDFREVSFDMGANSEEAASCDHAAPSACATGDGKVRRSVVDESLLSNRLALASATTQRASPVVHLFRKPERRKSSTSVCSGELFMRHAQDVSTDSVGDSSADASSSSPSPASAPHVLAAASQPTPRHPTPPYPERRAAGPPGRVPCSSTAGTAGTAPSTSLKHVMELVSAARADGVGKRDSFHELERIQYCDNETEAMCRAAQRQGASCNEGAMEGHTMEGEREGVIGEEARQGEMGERERGELRREGQKPSKGDRQYDSVSRVTRFGNVHIVSI